MPDHKRMNTGRPIIDKMLAKARDDFKTEEQNVLADAVAQTDGKIVVSFSDICRHHYHRFSVVMGNLGETYYLDGKAILQVEDVEMVEDETPPPSPPLHLTPMRIAVRFTRRISRLYLGEPPLWTVPDAPSDNRGVDILEEESKESPTIIWFDGDDPVEKPEVGSPIPSMTEETRFPLPSGDYLTNKTGGGLQNDEK